MSRARIPFLAIGHTARDEFPDGRWRLGGTALYGAATAAKLGAKVTLVTRAGPTELEVLDTLCTELGITLHALPSAVTTTFAFTYDAAGRRTLRLRARAAHGRAFAAVPNAELDAAFIGDAAHEAVESVDFPHQMAFAEPANGGIAGHGADGHESMRHQGGFRAHTGAGGCGFTAGMAAADDDDVERMIHSSTWNVISRYKILRRSHRRSPHA